MLTRHTGKREWLRAQYRAAGIEAVFDTIEAEATALSYLSIAEAEEFKERHGVAHQHARANVLDVANEGSHSMPLKESWADGVISSVDSNSNEAIDQFICLRSVRVGTWTVSSYGVGSSGSVRFSVVIDRFWG